MPPRLTRLLLLLLLLGLFPLARFLASPSPLSPAYAAPQAGTDEHELNLAQGVSDERAAERVRALCALGSRDGGSPSGEAAAATLKEWFEELGLTVELQKDPERSFWSMRSLELSAVRVGADGSEERVALGTGSPWKGTPTSSGRAPLSTSGVADGAWLTDSARLRGERRASVVLTDGANVADGSWPRSDRRLSRGSSTPVFGIGKPEADALRELLADGGALELEWQLTVDAGRAQPTTVVASLPAREGAPPGYVLFCAHGDADGGGVGANDNGSGVSIVLEIAQAWAEGIASGALPAPARELRFAIWGTEIHSTRRFLQDALADEEAPMLAVLNYDQAGYGHGADQLNLEPDDVAANVPLVRLLAGVLNDWSGKPGFPEQWATNKSLGGTDSYIFSGSDYFEQNEVGALTVFISAWDRAEDHPRTEGMPGQSWEESDTVRVDYDLYYHSAGDLPENTTDVEPYGMGWCARVGAIGAWRLLAGLE